MSIPNTQSGPNEIKFHSRTIQTGIGYQTGIFLRNSMNKNSIKIDLK